MAFTVGEWGQGRLLTGLSPSSTLSGFTAVITKDNLPVSALDGGALSCLNGGGDWRFSTDVDGFNQLPVEIVTCVTGGTPEFVAWIRFPSYATGTREVYAFWNKAGESQPPPSAAFGSEEVWQDYHFASDAGGSDSSGNITPVSNNISSAEGLYGEVAGAASFNGVDSNIFSDFTTTVAEPATISAWVKPSALGKEQTIGSGFGFLKFAGIGITSANNLVSEAWDSGSVSRSSNPTLLDIDTWYYAVGRYVAAGESYAVLDGVTAPSSLDARTIDLTSFSWGSNTYTSASASGFFDGEMTQLRVAKFASTEAQTNLEYNNQSSPATFWTLGDVFVPDGGGLTLSPISIATAEAFGAPVVVTGLVSLSPTPISSLESVGSPAMSVGSLFITPPPIDPEALVGIPVVLPQGVSIQPMTITSQEVVGTPTVVAGLRVVFPTGIFPEEFVGLPAINLLLKQIFPASILTGEDVGKPLVQGGSVLLIPIPDRATWNAVAAYLRTVSITFSGDDNDVICAWLRSEGIEDQYNDMWRDYFTSSGYLYNNLADQYAKWKRGETPEGFWILSSNFWDDSGFWLDSSTWQD